jgi:hypothetical protein
VKIAFAAIAFVFALFLAQTASAHTVGLSHGDYALEGATVHQKITLRSEDLARAVPAADADGDGKISDAELTTGRAALVAAIPGKTSARAGSTACMASPSTLHPDGTDGVAFELDWSCDAGAVTLDLGFLALLPSGHRHLASISAGGITRDELVVLAEPTITIGDATASPKTGPLALVEDGVVHILTGADHLAFLIGVLLSFAAVGGAESWRRRLGPLALMLTAFTIGHSAALATATIGGLAPPSRFIEPAVALSVAYIGLENLAGFRLRPRALVTLAFGFVHGFAYASGLLPLGIPRARLPVAVLSFNVGVELGQLAVVALVLPLLVLVERRPMFPRARQLVAGGLVIAGAVWFVLRVLDG